MNDGYNKLFSTIVTSTVWQEPNTTRIVWITMLALADKNGDVAGSVPGLANIANVSVDEFEGALQVLMSPDRHSRTKDHEGRRIVEIDGGWHLLNHGKYRAILSKESVRASKAAYMRRVRAGGKDSTVEQSGKSGQLYRGNDNDRAKAPDGALNSKEKAGARGTRLPADWEPSQGLKDYATNRQVDWKIELEAFRDWWKAATGQKAVKADWDATWRTWVRRAKPTLSAAASKPIGAKAALAKTEDPLQHAMSYARQRYERGEFGEVGTVAASDAFAEERRRITEKHRGKD